MYWGMIEQIVGNEYCIYGCVSFLLCGEWELSDRLGWGGYHSTYIYLRVISQPQEKPLKYAPGPQTTQIQYT